MILIVAAMKEEVFKIIENNQRKDIDIIITGVGKVNAAMKLSEYLTNHKVNKIINLGFVGGNINYQVNDIVVVDKAIYHDFDLSMFGYKKGQVPNYPELFEPDKSLYVAALKRLKTAKEGFLYTGDCFMTENIIEPSVFDMEGASLFQVAHYFKVPMLSVKLVSDVIGSKDHIDQYKTFEQEIGATLLLDVFNKLVEVL